MANGKYSMQPFFTQKVDFSKEIDTSKLKEQSVLVTGGASGLGQAFVEFLAGAGAYVTIFDFADDRGRAIAQRLSEAGHKVQFIHGDVLSWDDQIRAFDATLAFSPYNALDMVLIVAGVGGNNIREWLDNPTSPDGKLKRPEMKTVEVNLIGPWYSAHLALHYLRRSIKQETRSALSKQIVFVSSMECFMNSPYLTDYTVSKWGVRGLWRSVRNTPGLLGKDVGIKLRTSMLAPWFVKTPMTDPMEPVVARTGHTWTSLEDCVDCLRRIVCDESVNGRAIAVAPEGKSFDLCDDYQGQDGGKEFGAAMDNGVFKVKWESVNEFWSIMERVMNGGPSKNSTTGKL